MPAIHATAIVETADIADDAEVGPYCVIGPHVAIAAGCRLTAHVHVTGHTTIGARTKIAPFASLGTPPQSIKYRGGPTRLVVGADCDIREAVTMNTGTEDGGGVTEIGARCFFLVGSHVGHDCKVGSDVLVANNTVLGGHVMLGDHVMLGGQSAIHQHTRLGEGSMLSGFSAIASDLIPFGFAIGQRGVLDGLNIVGLRRRGYSREEIQRVRRAHRALFLGDGVFRERLAAVERDFAGDPLVEKILTFIREGGARPLLMESKRGGAEERSGDPPS